MADEDGRGEHQDRPRGKQPEHVPGFEAGAWQREADDDEDHHDQRIDHRLGAAAGDQSPTRQAVAIRHDLDLHHIARGRWHHRIHQGADECGAEEPEERRSPDFRQRDLPLPGMHSARAGVDRQREEEPAVFSLRERAAKLLEIELPRRHAEQQADNQDLDQPAIGGDSPQPPLRWPFNAGTARHAPPPRAILRLAIATDRFATRVIALFEPLPPESGGPGPGTNHPPARRHAGTSPWAVRIVNQPRANTSGSRMNAYAATEAAMRITPITT